jgi:aspartate kinase
MAVLVQKYGGSSVADVQKIGVVADRVVHARKQGDDVVVVVSAMGKTTDQLLELARSVAPGFDPPRRELDMLLTTGERVSMALLSIAIAARGLEAISFTGSQSGIITNDRHFDARIIEIRPHRIEDELARGKIVIIVGYQGMSYKREITTLGRGGSDTTAVALAAALGAERCEIYSDVDGVYSGDPKVVGGPKHLPTIDLDTLKELAEAGAKVLNAQAVEWARRAKIAIHARKTSDAPGTGKETVARLREMGEVGSVRAVAGMDKVVLLRAKDAEALAKAAADAGVPLVDVVATPQGACAAVPLLNVPDWEQRRVQLEASLGKAAIEPGKALVSVVGDELLASGRAVPAFLEALERVGASRASLVCGPLRIGAVIDAEHLAPAQRALHEAFCENV